MRGEKTTCTRSFDEALLSGYLDGALSHREAQKTRLHLEDCATCRTLLEELGAMREAARTTQLEEPDETAWPELPKTLGSRFTRSTGWMLLTAWTLVVSALALWRFVTSTGDPLEIFLVLGLPGAFFLLFVSVLLDRLHNLKTDRYRGIHR